MFGISRPAVNHSLVVSYWPMVTVWHYGNLHIHIQCTGPDALAVCRAHRGLPVRFLLLRYSVLFTVESLSLLLYLLVIS